MRFNRIYCTIYLVLLSRLSAVLCHRTGPGPTYPTYSSSTNASSYQPSSSIPAYGGIGTQNYYFQPDAQSAPNQDYIIDRTGSSLYPDSFSSFPDTFVLNLPPTHFNYGYPGQAPAQQSYAPESSFQLVVLDIGHKRTTEYIFYEYDQANRTHVFSAKPGYLIQSAIDGTETVWEPTNNRYADKITVKETPSGDFDIKVFVPIEGGSESDTEDHPPRRSYVQPTYAPQQQYPSYPQQQPQQIQPRQRLQSYQPSQLPAASRLIQIDIGKLFATAEVDYYLDPDDGCHIFTPRDGYNVNLVTKASELIWTYKGGDYPHQVVMCPGDDGKDKVQVLFPKTGAGYQSGYESSGERSMPRAPRSTYRDSRSSARSQYEEQYPRQRDRSSRQYEPSRRGSISSRQDYPPEFITIDIKKTSSSKYVSYEFDKTRNIHRFSCKQGYLVEKVTKGERTLRTFKPKNSPDRILVLPGPDNKPVLRAVFPGRSEGPIPEAKEHKPPKEHPPLAPGDMLVTLTSVDVKVKQSTEKIEYKVKEDGSELFSCKEGFMLRKVKKGQKIIWEWQEGRDTDYPNGVLVYVDDKGEKHVEVLMPEEEPQFVTVDVRYKQSTDEITYEYDHVKKRDLYTAKYPNLIYEVRKGNELLWYSRDKRYPYKLLVIPVEGQKPVLRVFYPKDQKPLSSEAVPMGKSDGYKPDKYPPTAAPVEPPDATTELKIPSESEVKALLEAAAKPEVKVKEAIHTVALNVHKKKDTSEFTYSHVGHIGTYVPKPNHFFSSVTRDKEEIWKTEDHNYANRVIMDGNGLFSHANNVTIYTTNNNIYHFNRNKDHKWVEISPELELDIAHKDNLMQIVHITQGKEQIYTTLHNYVFKSVREKEHLIWESDDSSRSTRVVLKEDDSHIKHLIIHLADGIVTFKKDKKTSNWLDEAAEALMADATPEAGPAKKADSKAASKGKAADKTKGADPELATKFVQEKIKILTLDSSDVTKKKENDTSKYSTKKDGEDVIYEFKRDAKCVELKYDDKSLWHFDDKINGNLYPSKLHYQKHNLMLILDFKHISLLFKLNGKTMSMDLVYTKRPKTIEVDLETSDTASQALSSAGSGSEKNAIDRSVSGSMVTHKIKPNEFFAINPVKIGSTILVSTDDPFFYVVLIKSEPAASPDKVYIELVNATKRQFVKSKEGAWTELSAEVKLFN